MGNAVLGFPNLVDQATRSGGSWLTSLPLSNLQNRVLSIVARSSSLLASATTYDYDLTATENVKIFGLIGHNLSRNATVRLMGCAAADFVTLLYDSGAVEVWPAVFSPGATNWENRAHVDDKYTEAEKRDYTWAFTHLLPANVAARYWRVEIADAGNSDSHVQIGRDFIGSAWQPVINMNYGANLGWETDTQEQRARGGALYFERRLPRRVQRFTLEHMDIDEALGNAFEIQRQAGIDGEVLFIYDPDDTTHSLRRRFLGRLRELSPIEDPYLNRHSTNFVIEELK